MRVTGRANGTKAHSRVHSRPHHGYGGPPGARTRPPSPQGHERHPAGAVTFHAEEGRQAERYARRCGEITAQPGSIAVATPCRDWSAPILRLSAVMDVIPTSRAADARGRQTQGRKRRALRARVVPPTPPTVAYERTPGAGSAPLPGAYRRHEPEKTVLHGVVRDHLETFLDRARGPEGDGYPRFVEHEFRRYLDCGLLCHGFARLRCAECGYERLVAFSCKGKLCPSCLARRTADTAAWLVDRLLPEAGYRQWVLTFPFTMRFRLAADRRLLTTMLGAFLQTLFAWQRRRGRALGIGRGQTGAVTFVQRFGGAMNLNPHLHSIVPDGLFVPDGDDGMMRFVPLPAPTTAEVAALADTAAGRLTDRLAADAEERSDYLDPDLAALVKAAS